MTATPGPAAIRLRRATVDDYAAAGEVTVAAYEPFVTGPSDGYVAKLRDAAARDAGAELWVATGADTDEVLGTVTICPVGSTWREIAGPDEGEFRMLAVAPEHQGRGVGHALVTLVVERFRAEGMAGLVLSSLSQMTAAHRTYERLGFSRVPDRDWSPGPGIDLIAFRKELS